MHVYSLGIQFLAGQSNEASIAAYMLLPLDLSLHNRVLAKYLFMQSCCRLGSCAAVLHHLYACG